MKTTFTPEEIDHFSRKVLNEAYELINGEKFSVNELLKYVKDIKEKLKPKIITSLDDGIILDIFFKIYFSFLVKQFGRVLQKNTEELGDVIEICFEIGNFCESLIGDKAFINALKWYGTGLRFKEDHKLLVEAVSSLLCQYLFKETKKYLLQRCYILLDKKNPVPADVKTSHYKFLLQLLEKCGGSISDKPNSEDEHSLDNRIAEFFFSYLYSKIANEIESKRGHFNSEVFEIIKPELDELKSAEAFRILEQLVTDLSNKIEVIENSHGITRDDTGAKEQKKQLMQYGKITHKAIGEERRSKFLKDDWTRHRNKLHDLRLSLQSGEITCDEYRKSFLDILATIFKNIEFLLGPPPTTFTALGLGSLPRGDLAPYSDIEFVIQLQDSENKDSYFAIFIKLVTAYLDALAFHGWKYEETKEGFKQFPIGHCYDPSFQCLQVETVTSMVQKIEEFFVFSDVTEQVKLNVCLGYGLLMPMELYKNDQIPLDRSDVDLFSKYKEGLQSIKIQEEIIDSVLRISKPRDPLQESLLSLKGDYLRPLVALCWAISISLKGINSCCMALDQNLGTLIENLVVDTNDSNVGNTQKERHLDRDFANDLLVAWKTLRQLRVKVQSKHPETSITECDFLAEDKEWKDYRQNIQKKLFLGQELTHLSKADYENLQWIYTDILQPTYNYLQDFRNWLNGKQSHFDPVICSVEIFKNIGDNGDIPTKVDDETCKQLKAYIKALSRRCRFDKEYMTSRVSTLHNQYLKLPDVYRCYLWDCILEYKSIHIEFYREIYKLLCDILNHDGWRPSIAAREYEWLEKLNKLFKDGEGPGEHEVVVQLCDLSILLNRPLELGDADTPFPIKTYRFHPDFYDELFDKEGYLRLDDNEINKTRHTVLPKKCNYQFPFCIKLLPENMPAEQFSFYLDAYMGGEGVPCGIPIKLIWKNHAFAAYLMEDVRYTPDQEPVLSLWETLQHHPERLNYLSKRSFTTTLQRVSLTNPEDDKGNDYFLVPEKKDQTQEEDQPESYALKRVDSERLFHEISEGTGKQEKPLVKTIIYFLNQVYEDDPLDKPLQQDLAKANNILMLQSIGKKLQIGQSYLQVLFTEDDVRSHYEKQAFATKCQLWKLRNTNFCLLTHIYTEEKLKEIHTRLDLMQGLIQVIGTYELKPHPAFLWIEIVQPKLADYYKYYLEDKKVGYVKEAPERALDRFNAFNQRYQLYDNLLSRQTANKAVQQTSGLLQPLKINVVLAAWQGEENSLQQFCNYFDELPRKTKTTFATSIKNMLDGKEVNEEKITGLDRRQQELLFKAFVFGIDKFNEKQGVRQKTGILFKHIPFRRLYLEKFKAILTPNLLSELISKTEKYLEILDIEGFNGISVANIEKALQCPQLKIFRLRNIGKINFFKNFLPFSTNTLKLNLERCEKLHNLEFINCNSLTSLTLNLHRPLKTLRIKNCHQLGELNLYVHHRVQLLDLSNSFKSIGNKIEFLTKIEDSIGQLQLSSEDVSSNIYLFSSINDPIYKKLSPETLACLIQIFLGRLQLTGFESLLQLTNKMERNGRDMVPVYKVFITFLIKRLQSADKTDLQETFDHLLKLGNQMPNENHEKVSLYNEMVTVLSKNLQSTDQKILQETVDLLERLRCQMQYKRRDMHLISLYYPSMIPVFIKELESEDVSICADAVYSMLSLKKEMQTIGMNVDSIKSSYPAMINGLCRKLKLEEKISAGQDSNPQIRLNIRLDAQKRFQEVINSLLRLKREMQQDGFNVSSITSQLLLVATVLSKKLESENPGLRELAVYQLLHLKRVDVNASPYYPAMVIALGKNLQLEDPGLSQEAFKYLLQLTHLMQQEKMDTGSIQSYLRVMFTGLSKKLESEVEEESREAISQLLIIFQQLQEEGLDMSFINSAGDAVIARALIKKLRVDYLSEFKEPDRNSISSHYSNIVTALCKNLQSEDNSSAQSAIDQLLQLQQLSQRIRWIGGLKYGLISSQYPTMITALSKGLSSKEEWIYHGAAYRLLELKQQMQEEGLDQTPITSLYSVMIAVLSNSLSSNVHSCQDAVDLMLRLKQKMQKEGLDINLIRSHYSTMIFALSKHLEEQNAGRREAVDRLLRLKEQMQQEKLNVSSITCLYLTMVTGLKQDLQSESEYVCQKAFSQLLPLRQHMLQDGWDKTLIISHYNAMITSLTENLESKNKWRRENAFDLLLKLKIEMGREEQDVTFIENLIDSVNPQVIAEIKSSWANKGPQLFQPNSSPLTPSKLTDVKTEKEEEVLEHNM